MVRQFWSFLFSCQKFARPRDDNVAESSQVVVSEDQASTGSVRGLRSGQ